MEGEEAAAPAEEKEGESAGAITKNSVDRICRVEKSVWKRQSKQEGKKKAEEEEGWRRWLWGRDKQQPGAGGGCGG